MVIATNLTSICCVNKEKLLKTMPFKRRLVGRQVSLLSMFLRHLADKKIVVLSALCLKQIQILWSINDVQMRRKKSWIIGCNISLIGLELFFLRSESICKFVCYTSFLTIFSLQTQQIEVKLVASNQHQIPFDVSLYLLSFFVITPLNESHKVVSHFFKSNF